MSATETSALPDYAPVPRSALGADIFTESTTFWVMESIRLDLGYGSQVHPCSDGNGAFGDDSPHSNHSS